MSSPYRNFQAFARSCFPDVDFSEQRYDCVVAMQDGLRDEISKVQEALRRAETVAEAAAPFAGINLCTCGHHHAADADGADEGCVDGCGCDAWTEHPLNTAYAVWREGKGT